MSTPPPLLPVLRPHDAGPPPPAPARPLLGGHGGADEPRVAFARDLGDRVAWVGTGSLAEVEAEALAHLAARRPEFAEEHDDDGRLSLLYCTDEYAAELVLDADRMRALGERLGRTFAVGIPRRGILLAAPMRRRPLALLTSATRRTWSDTPEAERLTPRVLAVVDGVPTGMVDEPGARDDEEEDDEAAPPPGGGRHSARWWIAVGLLALLAAWVLLAA